jgi:hypothetical protein
MKEYKCNFSIREHFTKGNKYIFLNTYIKENVLYYVLLDDTGNARNLNEDMIFHWFKEI